MSSTPPSTTSGATDAPSPAPVVALTIITVQNETDQLVTITAPTPTCTSPVPITVPAFSSISLPGLPIPTATPPTAQNAIELAIGASVTALLYTDGTGASYLTTDPVGTPKLLNRTSPPATITLQISTEETPGDISSAGIVPIYTVTLV